MKEVILNILLSLRKSGLSIKIGKMISDFNKGKSTMFNFFKKKEIKEDTFQKVIQESISKPIRKLSFTPLDLATFLKKVKANQNMKLLTFNEFVDKLDIILVNNQFKPWYSLTKGLSALDNGKFPVYKKIAYIDNIPIIDRFLTDEYKKFNFIFERVDLNKVLHNIAIAKETNTVLKNYEDTVRKALWGMDGMASNVVQFFAMTLLSQLIVFPMLMQQLKDLMKVRLANSLSMLDQYWVTIFWGLGHWEHMEYITFWLWVFFTVAFSWFLWDFSSAIIKTYFLYNAKYNVRLIDKVANELGFCAVILKNIKLLEVGENTWSYQYVNFGDFITKNNLEALKRGFVNDRFASDFSYVFQFYFQFSSMPVGKTFCLTDGFTNVIEDILTSYKTSISGAGEFNLGLVYNKIAKYRDTVAMKLFTKEHEKAKGQYMFALMMIMTATIIGNIVLSFTQGDGMNALVGNIK